MTRQSEAELTRATYDEIAAAYAESSAAGWPLLAVHLDRFCDRLAPAAVVADVGCGPGRDTRLLRARGLRAVGVDLSFGMLRAGSAGCEAGSPAAQADMRTLPIRTGALDGLWSQAALLHVPRRDVPRVLGEFHRALRPGAALFANTAEGDGERWEPVPYRPGRQRWFIYHRREEFARLVRDAGFEIVELTCESTKRDWINVHARKPARP